VAATGQLLVQATSQAARGQAVLCCNRLSLLMFTCPLKEGGAHCKQQQQQHMQMVQCYFIIGC
jgi:hypothetical protein